MLQTLHGFYHLQKVSGLRGTDAVLPVSNLHFNMFQPHITRPLPPVSSGLWVCPDQTPTLLSTQLTLLLQPFRDPPCQPCSGCSSRSSNREQASLLSAPTSLSSCAGFVGALSHPFLEKGMATHSSILAWRTPWTEGPGRLQSMGSQRVRHDSATDTLIFNFFSPLSVFIFWSLCPQAREQCARAQKEGEKRALPFPLLLQWVPVRPVFP